LDSYRTKAVESAARLPRWKTRVAQLSAFPVLDRRGGRRWVALTALLALFSFISVAGATAYAQEGTTASAAPVSEALRAQLLKLIPDPLPGEAHAQGAPTYYAANLWEYIDGAADQYQLYGLEGMLHQEFKSGKIDVTVDIFYMGKSENAFGIYATERSADAHFVAIGTEGYQSQSSDGSSATLNFLLDRYYVKLMGFGTGSPSLLDAFARGIAGRIGASAGWPELLARLPTAQRLPHSELYVLQNPLGHDYLSPAYSVKYSTGSGEASLVVSVAANEAEAQNRLGLLQKHLQKDGKCDDAPEFGEHAIRGSTSYEGEILARATGRYLVLMINPSGSASEIFREALTKLK